ncbi:hypothetical protein K502DRAFT_368309 [Neoconidiobolus thromboides FSU 785]|nr:hypothetical protein K502DRAFT_368309 [Neoconidiobolus thromboides FSU 785]
MKLITNNFKQPFPTSYDNQIKGKIINSYLYYIYDSYKLEIYSYKTCIKVIKLENLFKNSERLEIIDIIPIVFNQAYHLLLAINGFEFEYSQLFILNFRNMKLVPYEFTFQSNIKKMYLSNLLEPIVTWGDNENVYNNEEFNFNSSEYSVNNSEDYTIDSEESRNNNLDKQHYLLLIKLEDNKVVVFTIYKENLRNVNKMPLKIENITELKIGKANDIREIDILKVNNEKCLIAIGLQCGFINLFCYSFSNSYLLHTFHQILKLSINSFLFQQNNNLNQLYFLKLILHSSLTKNVHNDHGLIILLFGIEELIPLKDHKLPEVLFIQINLLTGEYKQLNVDKLIFKVIKKESQFLYLCNSNNNINDGDILVCNNSKVNNEDDEDINYNQLIQIYYDKEECQLKLLINYFDQHFNLINQTKLTNSYSQLSPEPPLDIHKEDNNNSIILLYSDRIEKLINLFEIEEEYKEPIKEALFTIDYNHWFITDVRLSPYTTQECSRIKKHREINDGELFIDRVLKKVINNNNNNMEPIYPPLTSEKLRYIMKETIECNCDKELKYFIYYYIGKDYIFDPNRFLNYLNELKIPKENIKQLEVYWNFDHGLPKDGLKLFQFYKFQQDDIKKILLNLFNYQMYSKYFKIFSMLKVKNFKFKKLAFFSLLNLNIVYAYLFINQQNFDIKVRNELFLLLLKFILIDNNQLSNINSLLKLQLKSHEKELLIQFLNEGNKPILKDVLILYYIKNYNYLKAIECFNINHDILSRGYNIQRYNHIKLIIHHLKLAIDDNNLTLNVEKTNEEEDNEISLITLCNLKVKLDMESINNKKDDDNFIKKQFNTTKVIRQPSNKLRKMKSLPSIKVSYPKLMRRNSYSAFRIEFTL